MWPCELGTGGVIVIVDRLVLVNNNMHEVVNVEHVHGGTVCCSTEHHRRVGGSDVEVGLGEGGVGDRGELGQNGCGVVCRWCHTLLSDGW